MPGRKGKRELWSLCLPWRKRKETWKEEAAGAKGLLKKKEGTCVHC